MRLAFSALLVALFAAVAMAAAPTFHDVIISFPKEAPDALVEEAKEMVRGSKGVVTHEYTIIKGFAAKVANNMFGEIQAMSSEFPPVIEGDGVMTTQGDK